MTYGTLISTVTVAAGGAASIDFNSIPQTYTDLVLVANARCAQVATITGAKISINGVTTNRSAVFLQGDGSSTASGPVTDEYIGNIPAASATTNTFGNLAIYFPNYAGSNNKTFSVDNITENNGTSANQFVVAGLWSNTAAITALSFYVTGQTLVQYSTASLYGVK